MRQGFTQQLHIGVTPISQVVIPGKSRSHLVALLAALQYIYTHKEWNQKISQLLYDHLQKGKKQTGRPGMSLWELFVLAQVRLCMDISYDELHHLANYDNLLRGILGVCPSDYTLGVQYEYQQIYDNVRLLDDELLVKLNDVIVGVGHEVFKKKESTALRLKTDSFVVETNTHFPTDYNLLWDSGRKCIEVSAHLAEKSHVQGWRKAPYWKRQFKGLMRQVGKISRAGGKHKAERLQQAAKDYVQKARQLQVKVIDSKDQYALNSMADVVLALQLDYYLKMLDKHIDLVERRLVKGEQIAHQEKVFSIFEPYTEWIVKGKQRPRVEIGKKLFVTTDQYDLIVDYQLGDHQTDNQLTLPIAQRLLDKYDNISSLSVDKGFSDQEDKALLELFIPQVIMPKKGRLTQQEKTLESAPAFKKLQHKHSAIESNINELEHRGLDRCPDRTWRGFQRYVGLGVCAYNLHKIGRQLLKQPVQVDKNTLDKSPFQQAA